MPSERLDITAHGHLAGEKEEEIKMRASDMAKNVTSKSKEDEEDKVLTVGACERTIPYRCDHHWAGEDGTHGMKGSSRKNESWLMEPIREILKDRSKP